MNILDVLLGKTRVGILERLEDEEYHFSFDENWLEVPNRPVLGQIFEDRIPDDIVTSGLPCWFAHLLPQGPLLRMIAREAGVEPEDDFEILRHIGEDLPGAVILMPGTNRAHRQRKPLVQTTPSGDGRLGSAVNTSLAFQTASLFIIKKRELRVLRSRSGVPLTRYVSNNSSHVDRGRLRLDRLGFSAIDDPQEAPTRRKLTVRRFWCAWRDRLSRRGFTRLRIQERTE